MAGINARLHSRLMRGAPGQDSRGWSAGRGRCLRLPAMHGGLADPPPSGVPVVGPGSKSRDIRARVVSQMPPQMRLLGRGLGTSPAAVSPRFNPTGASPRVRLEQAERGGGSATRS